MAAVSEVGEGTGAEDVASGGVTGADGLQPETANKTRMKGTSAETRERPALAAIFNLDTYWILAMWASISALRPGFSSTALA